MGSNEHAAHGAGRPPAADRWFEIKTQMHSKLLNSLSAEQLRALNKDSVREQIGNGSRETDPGRDAADDRGGTGDG